MTNESFIERTGVTCSAIELAALLKAVALPPNPGEVPKAEVITAIYSSALRHGLPTLKHGYYGIDLASGEFLETV